MTLLKDTNFLYLLGGLFALLAFASAIGILLAKRAKNEKSREVITNLNSRVNTWWGMIVIFIASTLIGAQGSILLFALMSLLALREYLALAPTLRSDHRLLLWLFFVALPMQYFLLSIQWYGLFAVFIPVYVFLFLQVRAALSGVTEDFLDRTARIQWALIVFVYFVSHAPALLMLDIPGYSSHGQNFKLLFFLVVVVQMSDVLQYVFGKLFGRHKLAPNVSPNKTVEGFVGGVGSAVGLGTLLYWMTPFSPIAAAAMSLAICLMGFAGGLVMSATKRDRGLKDFGNLLPGHGGIIDRIDSICFSAPILFHLTRYFYT